MLDNIRFEKILTEFRIFDDQRSTFIIQDSQDFIWLGTSRALARFDGQNLKIYEHDKSNSNGIPEGWVREMYENCSGNFTILIGNSTLVEFNRETETFKELNLPFSFGTIKFISTICEDSYGKIWIGMMEEGLYRFDPIQNTYFHYKKENTKNNKSISCDLIRSLYFDTENERLYIGTKTGIINIFDYKSQNFQNLNNRDNKDESPETNRIMQIFRDSRKNVWFCSDRGLFLYKQDMLTKFTNLDYDKYSISDNAISSICEDKNGLLWIGTSKGLNCFNPDDQKFVRYSYDRNNQNGIFHDKITTIACDKSNNIFFGTYQGGIGKINLDYKKFHEIRIESSESNKTKANIYSICKDPEKNIWVGTLRGGLYKCIPGENNNYRIIEIDELKGDSITGITCDEKNNVWITATEGLSYINIIDNNVKFIDDKIISESLQITDGYSLLRQCRDKINPNSLWLHLNNRSLILLDTDFQKIINNELVSKTFRNVSINCLFIDSFNNIWIGTRLDGLYKYNNAENKIVHYDFNEDDSQSISDSDILTVTEDLNNNIWVGTRNGGFNKLKNGENKFERFTTKNGIPSNCVNGIVVDNKNNLWVGLNNSIINFNTFNNKFIKIAESGNINLEGINRFAHYKSDDGIIYFGINSSVIYFNPDEITTNKYVPNVVLTDFQIFNESVKPSHESPFLKKDITYTNEIILSHKESVITFEFASLVYNNPKKNEYAYKMEGFDEDWVYCGTRRTATYTNLDPGQYNFSVKGSNNDGLWNEEGTSIKIIITPPWYKTLLFKGFVGLSVIGSIGSFYGKRIQQLNKEKRQQLEFTKKLIESQENERKRVAAELHDSLGQDLLIIKNKALVSLKKNDLAKFREQMNEISDLTSSALNEVREISYNLRPYELDRIGLTKTITSMLERANSSTNINFTGSIDDIDRIFIPEVEINIYRIIQESLNNVIKHSEAKEVVVSVSKKEKKILINISDDGKGFDIRKYEMNSKRKGFGLKGIEERVRLLNGEFNIESEAGKGTILEIQLTVSS